MIDEPVPTMPLMVPATSPTASTKRKFKVVVSCESGPGDAYEYGRKCSQQNKGAHADAVFTLRTWLMCAAGIEQMARTSVRQRVRPHLDLEDFRIGLNTAFAVEVRACA